MADRDRHPSHDATFDYADYTPTPARQVTPGKRTLTSHLPSPPFVFRVADPATATALGAALRGRDENGVAAGADQAIAAAEAAAGSPLPAPVQSKFEGSLGADLSTVRIHDGATSAQAATAVGAKAYTVGQDIHFAAGAYQPDTASGLHLLAHEVAHTVQQSGGPAVRQNQLEVSSPRDAAEVEADHAASAMVRGESARVGSTGTVFSRLFRSPDPTPAEEMADEAAYAIEQFNELPPPALASASSVDTMAQARSEKDRIARAQPNLASLKGQADAELIDMRQGSAEYNKAEKKVKACQGYIDKNQGVIASLDEIIALSTGYGVKTEGLETGPGFDEGLGNFNALFAIAIRDFKRLESTVDVALAHNPVKGDLPSNAKEEGKALGSAVASGGNPNASMSDVHSKVEQQDGDLKAAVAAFQAALGKFESAGHPEKINSGMQKCHTKRNNLKNVTTDISLGVVRPDAPEVTEAKAKVAAVNAKLAAARAAVDQVITVAEVAAAVLAAPAVGALGAGGAVTTAVEAIPYYGDAQKVMSGAGVAAKGVKDVTAGNVDAVGGIKDSIAKAMTGYNQKISEANAQLALVQANEAYNLSKLATERINTARGEVETAYGDLATDLKTAADQKAAVRDAATKIRELQAKKGGPKAGQPDVAVITTALAEASAFLVQAKATKEQGTKAKKVGEAMLAKRKELAGDQHEHAPGKQPREDFTGRREVSESRGQDNWIEATPAGTTYLLSMHPVRFNIMEGKEDKNIDGVQKELETQLTELDTSISTAEGFSQNLKRAMFGY